MCVLYVKGRGWCGGFQHLTSWIVSIDLLLVTKDKLNILVIYLENISGYFPSFKYKNRVLTSNVADA